MGNRHLGQNEPNRHCEHFVIDVASDNYGTSPHKLHATYFMFPTATNGSLPRCIARPEEIYDGVHRALATLSNSVVTCLRIIAWSLLHSNLCQSSGVSREDTGWDSFASGPESGSDGGDDV